MIWTQLPPDQPGYYWFFEEHRGETDVEIVECRRVYAPRGLETIYLKIGDGTVFRPETMGAGSYWMGPIPVPSKAGSYLGAA